MIHELRKKLIKISAISALAVLALIFIFIYIFSMRQLNGAMDMLTDRISENGGRFPAFNEEIVRQQHENRSMFRDFINEETRFSIRFFTVSFDENGQVRQQDVQEISSVTAQDAQGYAMRALGENQERGWIDGYRYKVYEITYDTGQGLQQGTEVIFVDGTMNRSVARMTLFSAGAVLTASWVIIVVLVALFSRKAVKPIAESYEKQKQFITDANHELKTPLTLIMTNIDIVSAEIGENEWLKDAKSEGKRMNCLINQLGILNQMDENASKKTKNTKQSENPFNLSAVLEEITSKFISAAKEKGQKIKIHICPDTTYVGDEEAIKKLIFILLDNAVKYCDEGGTIEIKLQQKRHAVIIVENSYYEVDNVQLDKLFDRFYREDKARTASNSFGIGLSIAKAIVNERRGEISAYRKDGKTIGFKVILK